MINAAKIISDKFYCAVLCKGSHSLNDANDLLYENGKYKWFNGKGIYQRYTCCDARFGKRKRADESCVWD